MKIYENYPEILNIKAKVLDKRFKNNISQVIVDKSIFMADDNELINDYKFLDDKEVIEVKENRGKLLISVDGKINNDQVILEVDKDLRYRNLSYNTAYILFQIFLEGFYGKIKTNLFLNEDEAYISLINYRDDIDPALFDEMINYAIDSSLHITTTAGITEIAGLGTVINSNICFNNTYKIIKFKVLDVHKDGKNTIISFAAGR
ncbi:hypothetical protein NH288_06560 [Anaerococcus sp. NML200537]|uniref:hypothetical protein n=1 Tax=Anaerococcus sp. NML200537 TaxID=2954485 RepID=UPI002238AB80|nr:hypothetical protein [Anaerococcus sp. NML200537]MCW6701746.1 hypothetical protein [Anaerococcus sp. NML200537]